MNYEDFIEYVSNLNPDYSIGVHGITGDGNYLEKAQGVLEHGLRTNGWGGILSNVQMLGQVKNLTEHDYKRLGEYTYAADHNDLIVNVLFAFPETLVNEEGKEYFLGHFNKVTGYAKGQDAAGDSLPLNKIAEQLHCVPKEFIVGYYVSKMESEDFTFYPNPFFYGNNEEMYKQKLEELLKEHRVGDTEREYKMIGFYKQFDMFNEYLRQLVEHVENQSLSKTQ